MKCSCTKCPINTCPHNTLKLKIDMFENGVSNIFYTEKCPLNDNYEGEIKNVF